MDRIATFASGVDYKKVRGVTVALQRVTQITPLYTCKPLVAASEKIHAIAREMGNSEGALIC